MGHEAVREGPPINHRRCGHPHVPTGSYVVGLLQAVSPENGVCTQLTWPGISYSAPAALACLRVMWSQPLGATQLVMTVTLNHNKDIQQHPHTFTNLGLHEEIAATGLAQNRQTQTLGKNSLVTRESAWLAL